MHHPQILVDLVVVFAVAGLAMLIFQRFRLPPVVGLLVAGMVVGPYGLSLIHEAERVMVLAEVGVVVLLFTVGLEISLSRLGRLWALMLRVGLPQVLGTGLVAFLATAWYFDRLGSAIFVGMMVAMSSTAIVLKVLSDRQELAAPHGRVAMAVLLFQDLMVIVCMLLVPLLAGRPEEDAPPFWLALLPGLGVFMLILVAARYLVSPFMYLVVRTQNRELFLIVIVVFCLGTAALTAATGLSLALGAFLAGLALSESEYAHQTLTEVLPFRDALASLFFVSVGMLLDLGFVVQHWLLVEVSVVAVLVLKILAAGIPTLLTGFTPRIAFLAGVALAQVGEFSFVLAARGLELGLLEMADFQTFLAVAVLTIALTPLLISASPHLAEQLQARLPQFNWGRMAALEAPPGDVPLRDHVLIAGYGINGRNLGRVLRDIDVPYVVMELNPETVRQLRKQGEPLVYGDCSQFATLEHLGVHHARVLVVAISDPSSTRRAVQAARQANPHLHIIVRTRYLAEVEELRKLGANEIIPEEFETSVEIFARVLREYEIPRNLILDLIDRIRGSHYEVLRDLRLPATKLELPFEIFSQVEVESCLVRAESPAVGQALKDLNLRATTGATIIAVRRNNQLQLNPGPEFQFQAEDIAVLIGDRPQVDRALVFFDPRLEASGEAS